MKPLTNNQLIALASFTSAIALNDLIWHVIDVLHSIIAVMIVFIQKAL